MDYLKRPGVIVVEKEVFMKQHRQPSRSRDQAMDTAKTTTIGRAAAAREKDERIRCGDYMAQHFIIRPVVRLVTRWPAFVRWMAERSNPGGYDYMIARTNHFDNTLRTALREEIDQLVILGAGNDSRPYRFRNDLKGRKIFEVDFPGTQAQKRANLQRARIEIPENVIFVPLDFNTQSLKDALLQAGYESGKRTFYLWEGVCFYLTPEAVDDVLKFVRQHSSPGSSIIFDYVLESFAKGEYRNERERKGAEAHAKLGEPYVFGIDAFRIEPFLNERGFSIVSDLGPQELDQTYLIRSDGTLHGHIFDFIRIVHASVRGKGSSK